MIPYLVLVLGALLLVVLARAVYRAGVRLAFRKGYLLAVDQFSDLLRRQAGSGVEPLLVVNAVVLREGLTDERVALMTRTLESDPKTSRSA